MNKFLRDHKVSTSIHLSINRVRCYLQLFSLAVIATCDGLKIRFDYNQGRPGDTVSQWDWHEEHPSKEDFTHWKWAMKHLVNKMHILRNPLGK